MTLRRKLVPILRFAGRLLAGSVLVALPLSACGTGPSADAPAANSPSGSPTQDATAAEKTRKRRRRRSSPAAPSPSAPGVFFPTQQPGVNSYPMALFGGKLLLDGEGCLHLRGGQGDVVPVWPPGFGADASGGEVRILNRKGRVVARVGDKIELAGGEGPRARAITFVDKRTKRELAERCPGQYWIAAPEVRVIRQG